MTIKQATLVPLMVLMIAVGCASPPQPTPGADYYPLAVGDQWTYRMTPGTKVYDAVVSQTTPVNGVTTYAMTIEQSYSFMAKQGQSVYQYGQGEPGSPNNAILFASPQLVYKLPFVVGDSWNVPVPSQPTIKGSDVVYVSSEVDNVESVTVPAGTFRNSVKVSVDDPRDSPSEMTDLWFAPNVGIVKTVTYLQVGNNPARATTTELTKYSLK